MTHTDYTAARAECQAAANKYGHLYRLRKDHFGQWVWYMVPAKKFQFGRDLEGELVIPENFEVAARLMDW